MTTKRVTATEAALILGCTRQHVHYLAKHGRLEVVDRIGASDMVMFDLAEVDELKAEREAARAS